jgi:methylmalonyl-CoA/ethylmalonyl-CoA epimerase
VFLELTQREHGEEKSKTFVRSTVESLYKDIERDQVAGVEQTIIEYKSSPVPLQRRQQTSHKRAS